MTAWGEVSSTGRETAGPPSVAGARVRCRSRARPARRVGERLQKGHQIVDLARGQPQRAQQPLAVGVQARLVQLRVVPHHGAQRRQAAVVHVGRGDRHWGQFRVPGLRNVAVTAPYMHDGSLATLEQVVDFYDKGGIKNKNLDETMKPLNLSAQEKKDLVEFLKALSGEGWQHLTAPQSFPQ